MKKNGFTLVELLAVIIILGLLALLIVPKVNSIVKESKVKSYEVSINNLVKSLNSIAIDKKANLVSFNGCIIDFDNDSNTCTDLEYSGELPDSGSISVDSDGNVFGSVGFGNDSFEVRNNKSTIISSGTEFVFDYTGAEQVFTVLTSGYYKLETWGAQGGNSTNDYVGGYGGYSTGIISLNTTDILYTNVGGQGETCSTEVCTANGGYNGGGNSRGKYLEKTIGAGGGATHIALKSGLLSSLENDIDKILIVSGGGAGSYFYNVNYRGKGGSAGGYIGNSGFMKCLNCGISEINHYASGGTNIGTGEIGSAASFGKGADANNTEKVGGGAGLYGGNSDSFNGGGGSSYIGNSRLINKYMSCFQCQESNDVSTKTISVNDESKVTEEPISGNPKKGNGFAKITYLGESID